MSLDCRPKWKREDDEEDGLGNIQVVAEKQRVMKVPSVYEKALAVPALLNPRATIDKIEPLTFEPGDRVDLAVYYTPANDEEIAWQTVVNVIRAGTKLVQERQHHEVMAPGQIRADCDTGLAMPSTPVTLEIEVWGHPDYWEDTWPDP